MKKSQTGALRTGTACPIVLFNGDKGGPGKSFTTRVLLWQMLASGASVHAFDGDPRNGHVDRHYGQVIPVVRCNLREEAGWSLVFDKLDSIPDNRFVVIDLPGGAGEHLHEEMGRLRFNEEFRRPLIHVWVADHGEDGVRLFKDLYGVGAPERTRAHRLCDEPERTARHQPLPHLAELGNADAVSYRRRHGSYDAASGLPAPRQDRRSPRSLRRAAAPSLLAIRSTHLPGVLCRGRGAAAPPC